VLGQLFSELKQRLGLSEARRLFDPFATPRQSKTRGRSKPVRDRRLLDFYDAFAERRDAESAPRLLAAFLHESNPGEFGNSAEAIEKHVRRLVKVREQEAESRIKSERQMRRSLTSIGTETRRDENKSRDSQELGILRDK
jgi:hypothetical protein